MQPDHKIHLMTGVSGWRASRFILSLMTIGRLKAAIAPLLDDLEIVIRAQWEDDNPNGNCFSLHAVVEDEDHGTGELFAAFECDQEFVAVEQPRTNGRRITQMAKERLEKISKPR